MSNIDLAIDEYIGRATSKAALAAASPEKAAKALALSAEGGDARLIAEDQSLVDQAKANARAAMVAGSPELQYYINTVPFAAQVSADDYERLQQFADAAKAREELTPEELQRRMDEFFKQDKLRIEKTLEAGDVGLQESARAISEGRGTLADYARVGIAVPGALVKGLLEGAISAFTAPRRAYEGELTRDQLIDEGINMGMNITPGTATIPRVTHRLKPGAEFKVPPELEVGMIDELFKIVQESATRKRAPSEAEAFVRQQVGDETVGVSADAVVRVYEEKGIRPAPGDEVLGRAEPHIAEAIDRALATGTDIELPLEKYLTRVEKDIHEAFLEDLRVRDGDTIREAKEVRKEETDISNPRAPLDIPETPVTMVAEPMRKQLFLDPLFEGPKAAGMTKPLYEAVGKRLEEYMADLDAAALRTAEDAARLRASQEWKDTLASEIRKAEAEFDARLDIAAEAMLRETGIKIATDEPVPRGLTAKDGVSADEIAEVLGYPDGATLIRDLAALEKDRGRQSPGQYKQNTVREWAELNTEARLGETERVIADRALEAVTSEPITKLLHEDLRALRSTSPDEVPAPLSYDEIRAYAMGLFGREPVAKARLPKTYLGAVSRAGKAAELAFAKKKFLKAFRAKNQQLVATLMAREAQLFNREYGKAQRLFDRFAKRDIVPSVSQEYTDQIQRLLVQHGVPLKRDLVNLADAIRADGRTLETFVKEKTEVDGYDLAVADWLYDDAFQVSVDKMTVQQFGEFADSIKSLAHVGAEERTVFREGQKIELAAARNEIVANLETFPLRLPGRRGIRESVTHGRYAIDALLVKLEYVFDELDLRSPDGPWNQYVLKPLTEAKFREDDLFVQAGRQLGELPGVKNARTRVANDFEHPMRPGQTYDLNRADVVMMGLHLGNKRNTELLVRTLLPEDRFPDYAAAEARVRDFVNQILDKEDWDYVQGIWDFFAGLKPEIDALYRRTTGVAPDSVEGVRVATPHGDYRGGYAPIIHDGLTSADRIKSEKASFDYDYHRATTPNKYTVSRTKVFDRLQVENYYDHLWLRVREMLHDIAFREAVQNARKIITDRSVREAFNKHYGPEYADMLHPWLKDIANRFNVEDRSMAWMSGFLRGTRKNLVIATLGLNLKTILTPQIGPLLVDAAVSPVDTARILKDLSSHWNFAMERSGELRHRIENYDRDIRAALQDQLGVTTPFAQFQRAAARFGMYPAVMIDTTLAMVTWLGHYRKALRANPDEGAAIFAADKAVRNYFGAAGRTDLAMIMRGSESSKLLTMFYGYMNGAYNGTRDAVQFSRSGARLVKSGDYAGARRDFAHAFGQTMRWVIVPAILGIVYAPELIEGIDDAGSFAKAVFKVGASQLAGTVPVVREVASTVISGFPSRGSPSVEIAKKVTQAIGGLTDPESDRWLRYLISTPGYVFGIPTNQAAISAQFLWNLGHNIDNAKSFGDFLQGIIYGETENKKRRRRR